MAVSKIVTVGNFPNGVNNVALGNQALDAASGANGYSVAVGSRSLTSMTSGGSNVGVGFDALYSLTTGASNVAIGTSSADSLTTGNYNIAVGDNALQANTTASNNTAVGYQAGYSNTTGAQNTFIGRQAGQNVTTASQTILVGNAAGRDGTMTGDYNLGIGSACMNAMTSGTNNLALHRDALGSNTTGANNVAVGYQTLTSNTTASNNTAVGYQAGYNTTTSSGSVYVGYLSGQNTTSLQNTFVGSGSGYLVTSGAKNTIIGTYSGNQGGLDIRGSSNNIVLSDGDGNRRLVARSGADGNGTIHIGDFIGGTYDDPGWNGKYGITFRNLGADYPAIMVNSKGAHYFYKTTLTDSNMFSFQYKAALGAGATTVGTITVTTSSTSYNTSSDYRLKENVVELTGATDRLKQLEPKRFNFIADADTTVDGFLAHEVQSVVPEAISGTHNEVDADGNPVYQGIDQSKLVPLLVATIKELEARITALENA